MKLKLNQVSFLFFILFSTIYSCSNDTDVGVSEENYEFGINFDRNKLDSLFSILEEKNLGMGSVAIFKDGQIDYQKTYGHADLENSISATVQTKYRIGSITKTFTASMIMQLIDENSLTLSTTLDNFFPELPNSNLITIENLLRHRSGLFNYTDKPYGIDIITQPATQQELIDTFIQNGTVFNPDEKAIYSNTNYVVLGFIIEHIDEKSFSESLRDRITVPLGLTNTYLGGDIETSNNEALSYYSQSNNWVLATEINSTLVRAAGAIVSNPEDLNTFYHELFAGNIVSQNSLETMQVISDGFGIGMVPIPFYDKSSLGHTGLIDGFQSYILHFPVEDVTLSFTLNGVSMPANDVAIGILSIYSGLAYELP